MEIWTYARQADRQPHIRPQVFLNPKGRIKVLREQRPLPPLVVSGWKQNEQLYYYQLKAQQETFKLETDISVSNAELKIKESFEMSSQVGQTAQTTKRADGEDGRKRKTQKKKML